MLKCIHQDELFGVREKVIFARKIKGFVCHAAVLEVPVFHSFLYVSTLEIVDSYLNYLLIQELYSCLLDCLDFPRMIVLSGIYLLKLKIKKNNSELAVDHTMYVSF